MKNKAKCKLCREVIESFHSEDYAVCKCDEISVFGGESMRCSAKNWENFIRIEDNGNEVRVAIKEEIKDEPVSYPIQSKKDLIHQLHEMTKYIETLPSHAMNSPISHYDLFSLTALLVAIFRSDLKEES